MIFVLELMKVTSQSAFFIVYDKEGKIIPLWSGRELKKEGFGRSCGKKIGGVSLDVCDCGTGQSLEGV